MPSSIGTRNRQNFRRERAGQGSDTRSRNQDLGMAKRVVSDATFAAAGTITGADGDFANFSANDTIQVDGANLNNGFFNVTAIDGANRAFVTVDPPPKAEGPIQVTIRAA